MLNDLILRYGLDKINSFTKYPSILTYHELGERGLLQNKVPQPFSDEIYITEKIDGTNTRIVLFGGDYLIGSREDFIYARGDRIINPTMGIVNAVKDIVFPVVNKFTVIFGEVYGGNIGSSAKEYSNSRRFGFRIFDVIQTNDFNILNEDLHTISNWRENGGQSYLSVPDLIVFSRESNLEIVPYLGVVKNIPKDLSGTFEWLKTFKTTLAGIDNVGKAEGVVIRNENRTLIRKIRFEDYERTQKRGGF
jgi:hypothetical protein